MTAGLDWPPTAGREFLVERAQLLARVRRFFAAVGVLEVETPLLSFTGATDPGLASLCTRYTGPTAPHGTDLYLQTSPELAMKRLLAAGSGPIYQVCKAFRDGERGRRHNPEFTLLEWYRPGVELPALIDEVVGLLRDVLPNRPLDERLTYAQAFERVLGIDPHGADAEGLRRAAVAAGVPDADALDLPTRDAWLDLLMTHCIEPSFDPRAITAVVDYPASQAALARVRPGDPLVAERFEVYLGGMELANGFHELTDPAEQRRRFAADNARRRASGLREMPVDERFLAALEAGLPDCSGVALGLDRLLMLVAGAEDIADVLAFPLERA